MLWSAVCGGGAFTPPLLLPEEAEGFPKLPTLLDRKVEAERRQESECSCQVWIFVMRSCLHVKLLFGVYESSSDQKHPAAGTIQPLDST